MQAYDNVQFGGVNEGAKEVNSMPSSNHRLISWILEAVLDIQPASILDVGCGMGKYGVLCREYVDSHRSDSARTRIDCIEAFPPYINDLHRYVYDHIYLGEAQDILPTLETHYDLALIIDVFEHLDENAGARLIQECRLVTDNILISVPTVFFQNEFDVNAYEKHRAQYDPVKLRRLGFSQIWRVSGNYLCLASSKSLPIKRRLIVGMMAGLIPYRLMSLIDNYRSKQLDQ